MSLRLETEMKANIVKWYYKNVKSIVRTQRMVLALKTVPGAGLLASCFTLVNSLESVLCSD